MIYPGLPCAEVTVTRYGLDGPETESLWGRDSLQPSIPMQGLTMQLLPGLSRT